MSSSDEDSTTYIQRYFVDPQMLNTFVNLVEEEEEMKAESSRIPRAPRRYIPRNHADAAARLYNHYFAPQPVFPADYFRRCFRMPKEMFIRIVKYIQTFNAIQQLPPHFQYFRNPPVDVAGVPTLNIFQKCTSVVRQLAYGASADINVLHESDLFDQLLEDRAPVVNFTANGEQFTKGYYLADGIYPEWSTLVKSFKCPMDPKTTKFKRYQEAARKDVERAFGCFKVVSISSLTERVH